MAAKKNVVDDILASFLERNLFLKFDICTCGLCKKKMLEHLQKQFLPRYIDEHDPDLPEIRREFVKKNSHKIFAEVKKAIDTVSANMPHPVDEDKDKAFDLLLLRIRQARGIDFSQYFKNILKRRVALRMVATKAGSYLEYLTVLNDHPGEYEKLFNVLTINVSEFFRDPPVWSKIKQVLDTLINEHTAGNRPLNIWSAGCALGQEPYSLAMLVREKKLLSIPVSIRATDVDKECLEKARAAVYSGDVIDKAIENAEQGEGLPSVLDLFSLQEYKYYLKPEVKELVSFEYLDLTSQNYLKDMDMIVCRNVFIYFTKALQEQILDKFFRSLRPGGYLVIGKAEMLPPEARTVFAMIDPANRIYQKIA